MREENIFYNLTNDDENSTTELLCNLCKNAIYKDIIMSSLKLNDLKINYEHIETQKSISGKEKIPDIMIENDDIRIFVENKVK
jgi:hypothetical protein